MSGGHFNGSGYTYYQVHQFADELENEISNNNKPDEYGCCPSLTPEIISYLEKQVPIIRKIARVMKEIDYLYSGDHGEDNFLKIVEKLERE